MFADTDLRVAMPVPVEEAPKKRMLFLDGRSERIHGALERFGHEYHVTIVTNVTEALRFLSREDYDVVHLEHDLSGFEFCDPDLPESGMEMVRYISKTGWPGGKRKPIFKIHSYNLFAAFLLVTSLQKLGLMAYYEPFDDNAPLDTVHTDWRPT